MAVAETEQTSFHEKSQADDFRPERIIVGGNTNDVGPVSSRGTDTIQFVKNDTTTTSMGTVTATETEMVTGTATVREARVSDRERLELMALYPAALEKKPDRLPAGYVDDGEPRFFLHVKNDRVEGFLAPFGDTIDFSLPHTCVSSAEFVGLRKIPTRRASDNESSSNKVTSPPSQKSVKSVILGILRKGQKVSDGQDNLPGIKSTNLWMSEGKQGKSNIPDGRLYNDFPILSPEGPSPRSLKGGIDNGGPASGIFSESNSVRPRRETWPRSWVAEDGKGLQMFELLWKEGRSGGLIRRLKFETNEGGYNLLCSKINWWAAAAQGNNICTDAAEAAIAACGGNIKENQPYRRWSSDDEGGASAKRSVSVGRPVFGLKTLQSFRSRSFRETSEYQGGDVDKSREDGAQSDLSSRSQKDTKEPMGTLADGRARIHAAKQAVEIAGTNTKLAQGDLPENVITWGSIMVEGKVLPKRDGSSQVLKDHHFKALAAALPARLRSSSWVLLYSTSRDGISLNTLYRKVVKKGPSILIAKDTKQHVFGCFSSEEWKVATRYYGNGECFVFQVKPELKAFRWTRANSYFMYSTSRVLAMGGGAHYSLHINADLISGCSGECETFGSVPLAGSEDFELLHVEVWGFR